jgi:ATP-dependent Clp protease ATP-binding subunit ClpC
MKKDILNKELKKFFAPEFLNRIDDTIVFNALNEDHIKKIVKIELDKLFDRVKELKYNISYDDSLIDMVSKAGFDETYGARPIKRAIQDKIEDFISEEILKSNLIIGETYLIKSENDEVKLEKPKEKKIKKKKGD